MKQQSRKETNAARILLVGDNSQAMSTQAAMLSTHGYDVATVKDASEARARWSACPPDLVLIALNESADRNFGVWHGIREWAPAQRVGFLLSGTQHLCRVFLNGELILRGEGPENIVERVGTLLAKG